MRNPRPGSAARVAFVFLFAIAIALPNMAAGCPGEGPPPIDLPELATTAAVGTLAGSSAVSDDGTFSYTIPIPIPPGRAGMQPSLAISYSSTPAESALGVGFRVDGLSAITRCGQSVAVDGQHRGVHLDEEDRLCLDGARLLAVEGADLSPARSTAPSRRAGDASRPSRRTRRASRARWRSSSACQMAASGSTARRTGASR